MSIENATLAQVNDLYDAAYKLVKALQPFKQGDADPAEGTFGSATAADLDTLVGEVSTAADAVADAEAA